MPRIPHSAVGKGFSTPVSMMSIPYRGSDAIGWTKLAPLRGSQPLPGCPVAGVHTPASMMSPLRGSDAIVWTGLAPLRGSQPLPGCPVAGVHTPASMMSPLRGFGKRCDGVVLDMVTRFDTRGCQPPTVRRGEFQLPPITRGVGVSQPRVSTPALAWAGGGVPAKCEPRSGAIIKAGVSTPALEWAGGGGGRQLLPFPAGDRNRQ